MMPDLKTTFDKLAAAYGPRHWWPAETPFEVAIGAILTQNTNWKNVEMAIANLRCEVDLTPQALSALSREKLEELIRPSGFFRQKTERLLLLADYLRQNHKGRLENLLSHPLEDAREELLQLKGIGPETADSILLYAGEHPSFVVDAYTKRLFSRLGNLQGSETYEQVRSLFMSHLPPDTDLYNEYHALIVEHCKQYCRVRPLCSECSLAPTCSYVKK